MSDQFTPDEELTIDDLETLKVVSDPLRINILEAMSEPTTVKQVAEQVGVGQKKLYYHVNLLEKHGLIAVVDERVVSGIIEKWYQVRAYSFRVERSLLSVAEDKGENWRMLLGSIFENTIEDVIAAAESGVLPQKDQPEGKGPMLLVRSRFYLSPEQFDEFKKRLADLIAEMNEAEGDPPDKSQPRCGLTIAFYPAAPPKSAPADEEPQERS
jgi:DNA-binding transcriptional ArsR family regulator